MFGRKHQWNHLDLNFLWLKFFTKNLISLVLRDVSSCLHYFSFYQFWKLWVFSQGIYFWACHIYFNVFLIIQFLYYFWVLVIFEEYLCLFLLHISNKLDFILTFSLYLLYLKNFYWSVVDLQCYTSFRCAAKWLSCNTCMFIYLSIFR